MDNCVKSEGLGLTNCSEKSHFDVDSTPPTAMGGDVGSTLVANDDVNRV